MIQHIISRWLLRSFATKRGRPALVQYDKATGEFGKTSPDDFLVEQDAHSDVIEQAIEAIETPAAHAGRRLGKEFRNRRPGIYAMVDETAATNMGADELRPVGSVGGSDLLVTGYEAAWPARSDLRSLASYIGLMYQRSPKLEEAMRQWGQTWNRAAQRVLDELLPGFRVNLDELKNLRARMIPRTERIGQQLEAANWFVVRSPDEESFVLSDCPVVATIALGHDDTWRAIFANEAYVVVMPIGPKIALVVAPGVIPLSRIEPQDLTRTINRLVWRSADRYVLAQDRDALEFALPDAAARGATVAVEQDPNLEIKAMATVLRIVTLVMFRREEKATWIRWDGCRLIVGHDLRQPPIGR